MKKNQTIYEVYECSSTKAFFFCFFRVWWGFWQISGCCWKSEMNPDSIVNEQTALLPTKRAKWYNIHVKEANNQSIKNNIHE